MRKSEGRGSRSTSRGPRRPREGGRPGVRNRLVIGLHAGREAIRVRPQAIQKIWLRSDWSSVPALRALVEEIRSRRIPIHEKPKGLLDTYGSGHQGLAVEVSESPELNWEQLEAKTHSTLLVLDGLEDPQNLGSILRTAWLMAVDGIFIPQDRAVGLTPVVCKVASGGVEHVPVEATSDFASLFERLKKMGYWIFGLDERGESDLYQMNLPEKVVWVVGAEGEGLRRGTAKKCDQLVKIPQVPGGSSYNAAIACALCVGETFRQRRKAGITSI